MANINKNISWVEPNFIYKKTKDILVEGEEGKLDTNQDIIYETTELIAVDKKNDITYTRRDLPKAIKMSNSINSTYATEISCVAKYLAKNPGEKDSFKTIIYLTDGYIEEYPSFPPNSEIIFVIPADGTDAIVKNFGKVIRIV